MIRKLLNTSTSSSQILANNLVESMRVLLFLSLVMSRSASAQKQKKIVMIF